MRVPRPRLWDVLFALAGAAALAGEGIVPGTGSAAVAVALALLACAPLAWSSQAPLTALLGVAVGLVACLVVFHPYDTAIFVAAIALYNVANFGDRRRSLLVGAGTAVFLVTVIVIIGPLVEVSRAIEMVVPGLSLTIGPPIVPPNWLRRKSWRGLPSEVAAVSDSVRKYSKPLPWISFVPDLVMTLTTPPAVRPNSAFAPLAMT